MADKISPTFQKQKNSAKNMTVTQCQTGKHLCPVRIWEDIISILESYPDTTDDTQDKKVWVYNFKAIITSHIIISTLISEALYSGENQLGF